MQTTFLSPARNTQVAPSADDMAGKSDENYAQLSTHWGNWTSPSELDSGWMQCGAVITQSIFSKILTIDSPKLAYEDKLWNVFCDFKSRSMFNLCLRTNVFDILLYQIVL